MYSGIATGGAYISADTLGYSSSSETGRCGRGVICFAAPRPAGVCVQLVASYACCAGRTSHGLPPTGSWSFGVSDRKNLLDAERILYVHAWTALLGLLLGGF